MARIITAYCVLLFMLEPGVPAALVYGSYAFGFFVCWYVPVGFKSRHVREQNQLLDHCRALLMVGMRAAEAGDFVAAERKLADIRAIERHWRLGNSLLFRISLAVWAVGAAATACVVIRALSFSAAHIGNEGQVVTLADLFFDVKIALAASMSAPLWALINYMGSWANPWAMNDCGDQLWQLLYGPRTVDVRPGVTGADVPYFDGMTPLQIFGIGTHFTRGELNKARRELVRRLHPDRWHAASASERSLREEALKRVNAAYDALRSGI